MKLTDREWKVFALTGANGLFPIKATSTGIDAINLKKGVREKKLPYITRTESNNGISEFISMDNECFGNDLGNCITIGLDTQTAYWQPFAFVTGQNIHVLRSDKLSYYSSHFMTVILRNQMKSKFNWGGNGATLGRLKKLRILLPADSYGVPDYQFMEDYVKELIEKKKTQYRLFVKELKEDIGTVNFNKKEWSDFPVPYVFDEIQRGKRLKNADHIEGNVPYVSSTALNNGVDDFIIDTKGTRVFSDCISLANSGSVGSAFYEPFRFVASDHITHLKSKNANMYIYLFIISVLKKQKTNFNFNREINDQRINRMRVMLPIDNNGNPDYAFMEQYGKMLVARKYKQYFDYLKDRNS